MGVQNPQKGELIGVELWQLVRIKEQSKYIRDTLAQSSGYVELAEDDIAWLKQGGESDADIKQISRAISCTQYKWVDETGASRSIRTCVAVELLGRENFLSGIERSAFHRTAVRECESGLGKVYFDSSRLFNAKEESL